MSINNAAVDLDKGKPLCGSIETLRQMMEVNPYGALGPCRGFIPLVKQNNARPVGTCFLSAIFF